MKSVVVLILDASKPVYKNVRVPFFLYISSVQYYTKNTPKYWQSKWSPPPPQSYTIKGKFKSYRNSKHFLCYNTINSRLTKFVNKHIQL